jgi:hypothetical protein
MPSGFEAYDPTVKPPYIRRQYPRLRREESKVLAQYLDEQGTDAIEQLRTAVPVGEGEVPGEPDNRFQRQAKALSQWKIDAVVDYPGRQEIVELKSRATHTAVGQVLAYDIALGERNDEPTESRPVVAAFRVHPDLPAFARLVNVQVHTVPDADPSTATQRFRRDLEQFRGNDE